MQQTRCLSNLGPFDIWSAGRTGAANTGWVSLSAGDAADDDSAASQVRAEGRGVRDEGQEQEEEKAISRHRQEV